VDPVYHAGMQVLDNEGRYAGTVEDVLSDKHGAARYLVVRDRGIFSDDVVLPVSGARLMGDSIHYALKRDEIHNSERYSEQRFGAAAGFTSAATANYDLQDEAR
jgi:hypothetical protein